MEQLDLVAGILAMTMGAAWASGINLYAAILVIGLMGSTDRKSTRLNSSHITISYAVFCLKKKKTKKLQSRSFSCNQ